MSIHYLFGSGSVSSDELAIKLAKLLHVDLEARDSSYTGEYYRYEWILPNRAELLIQKNYIPIEKESLEIEFKEYTTLVYFSFEEESQPIANVLSTLKSELKILRRKHI